MFKHGLTWSHSPLRRNEEDHENFAREIIETLYKVRNKEPHKIDIICTGDVVDPGVGLIGLRRKGMKSRKYKLKFAYLDVIPLRLMEAFKTRFGRFLNSNGYELNPFTYAVMIVLHEMGHIEYNDVMLDNDAMYLYNHIDFYGRKLMNLTFDDQDRDIELLEQGIDIRYMLNGDEMYCDGFAMIYFRAVTNVLVEKGFPADILTKQFKIEDCVQV